jgi:hypothetical protein
MSEKMKFIGDPLRSLIEERGIIARCELLHRIYGFVRSADLSPSEREELENIFDGPIAPGIFASIMSGDPLPGLPKFDSFINIKGRIFHFVHTKSHPKEDFETAYNLFLDAREEIRELVVLNLKDLLLDFMTSAGYRLDENTRGNMVFSKNHDKRDCLIFPNISSADVDAIRDSVVLVPHGESPGPFIQFYQEKGRAAEDAGISIWVANLEEGTIDPFMGYPKDLEIYKQFKNPRLAMRIRSTWGTPL